MGERGRAAENRHVPWRRPTRRWPPWPNAGGAASQEEFRQPRHDSRSSGCTIASCATSVRRCWCCSSQSPGAADRLRQRRESASRPRQRPDARSGRTRGGRRRAAPPGSADSLRKAWCWVAPARWQALLVAVWSTRALVAAGPASIPRLGDVGMDGRVLAFVIRRCSRDEYRVRAGAGVRHCGQLLGAHDLRCRTWHGGVIPEPGCEKYWSSPKWRSRWSCWLAPDC